MQTDVYLAIVFEEKQPLLRFLEIKNFQTARVGSLKLRAVEILAGAGHPNINPERVSVYFAGIHKDRVKDEYTHRNEKEPLSDAMTLRVLFRNYEIQDDFVDIVAVLESDDPAAVAIRKLKTKHGEAFECLRLTVGQAKKWTVDDLSRNNATFVTETSSLLYAAAVSSLVDVGKKLQEKRRIGRDLSTSRLFEELQSGIAQSLVSKTFDVVEDTTTSRKAVSPACTKQELVSFLTVVLGFKEHVERVMKDASSSLKTAAFTSGFIYPAFFEHEKKMGITYQQSRWAYPIFIEPQDRQIQKYKPHSDFNVVSNTHDCHLLNAEIISKKNEEDRYRLLLQAVAVARLGSFFAVEGEFVTMAIYLTKDLVAERYLLRKDPASVQVYIIQKNFTLNKLEDSFEFLTEMYNFGSIMAYYLGKLDPARTGLLKKIADLAEGVPSLHSAQPAAAAARPVPKIDPIPDDTKEPAPFDTKAARDTLAKQNYEVFEVADEYPHLVSIREKTSGEVYMLKFVKPPFEAEVAALRFLSSIDSPRNHTLRPLRFWDTEGGTYISMPPGGRNLVYFWTKVAEMLVSVALQLIEGVAFLHEHGLAHLDLKPQNVLVHSSGRLSIIDFGLSVFTKDLHSKFVEGFRGTRGYTAPEVGSQPFDPVRADLWACGQVIDFIFLGCEHKSTPMVEVLLDVSRQLLNVDPAKRPSLAKVEQSLAESRLVSSIAPVPYEIGPAYVPAVA